MAGSANQRQRSGEHPEHMVDEHLYTRLDRKEKREETPLWESLQMKLQLAMCVFASLSNNLWGHLCCWHNILASTNTQHVPPWTMFKALSFTVNELKRLRVQFGVGTSCLYLKVKKENSPQDCIALQRLSWLTLMFFPKRQ